MKVDMPKVIIPSKEVVNANWNRHLPVPLEQGEKVIVCSDQGDVPSGYILVKHGGKGNKVVSSFHLRDFTDIKGNPL